MNPETKIKSPRFKKKESGYHSAAVKILAEWLDGVIEKEFYLDGRIVFVPDVTVYKNDVLVSIYEVYHTHPLDGKKLGLIQEWCFRNQTDLSVFEVSADYILTQTEKPEFVRVMSCHIVDPFENNYNPGDREDLYEL